MPVTPDGGSQPFAELADSPHPPPLLLRQARLADGRVADVAIENGLIASIDDPSARDSAVNGAAARAPGDVLDLSGYMLLPALAEPHAHLDKALTVASVANPDGTLRGAASAWLAARRDIAAADIAARAWTAATRYLAHGTTAIRTHVDVGEGIGLRAIEAVLSVRDRLAGIVDIQVVALTSAPVTGRAGASNRALLREALAAGADLAGGAPAFDSDPAGAVEVFAVLAGDAGTGLDLHVDETTDASVFSLPRLIDVAAADFGYPITASHAVSLGAQPGWRRQEVARALAAAGIAVITLPQTNLYLQGRGLGPDAPRGLTPVRELLDAGVVLAAGGDNLQDPFNPVGRADPLEAASLLVTAGHLAPGEALTAVTRAARKALRLPAGAIEPGGPADLVAVRATSLINAIGAAPQDRIVLRGGRVVARTAVTTDLAVGRAAGVPPVARETGTWN